MTRSARGSAVGGRWRRKLSQGETGRLVVQMDVPTMLLSKNRPGRGDGMSRTSGYSDGIGVAAVSRERHSPGNRDVGWGGRRDCCAAEIRLCRSR